MRREGPAMPGASDQRQRVRFAYSFAAGGTQRSGGGTQTAGDPRPESGNVPRIIRIGEIDGSYDPHGYRKPEGPADFLSTEKTPPLIPHLARSHAKRRTVHRGGGAVATDRP